MKRSWAKGQAAIVNALKRNTAFATKHGNAFNKIKLKSGDTDAAEWLKFQAFTTAVVEDEKLRLKIKKGIAQALERGETKKQFLNSLPKVLNEFKSKLKTTFETNQALAFGAAQQAKLIEVSEDFPYWKYSAIHDAHTRPDHAALDGKIFESTDHRFYPPIGYNCRCTAIPLTAAQAGRTDQNQFMHPKQELKQPIASAEFVGNKQKNFLKWLQSKQLQPESQKLIKGAVMVLMAHTNVPSVKIMENRKAVKLFAEKHLQGRDLFTPDGYLFNLTKSDIRQILSKPHDEILERNNLLKNITEILPKLRLENTATENKGDKNVTQWRYYQYKNKFYFNFKRMLSGELKLHSIGDKLRRADKPPSS